MLHASRQFWNNEHTHTRTTRKIESKRNNIEEKEKKCLKNFSIVCIAIVSSIVYLQLLNREKGASYELKLKVRKKSDRNKRKSPELKKKNKTLERLTFRSKIHILCGEVFMPIKQLSYGKRVKWLCSRFSSVIVLCIPLFPISMWTRAQNSFLFAFNSCQTMKWMHTNPEIQLYELQATDGALNTETYLHSTYILIAIQTVFTFRSILLEKFRGIEIWTGNNTISQDKTTNRAATVWRCFIFLLFLFFFTFSIFYLELK